ncbi:TonB-dependent receptor plug domain-containing protein [Chryseobacterium sp. BIGb0232]|uniref:TonB-dependent receptor plug domain-containing protein n=1 Tax=Chryseobacterium sp. BIGb0232 TaxID=2940598 RepID=UPI000F4633B5|nr:TonB-dependent receptor plug domain-containing protein [Chryseobacterium sp. BIGb0232]MCS4301112.1 TonB-dependent SusC/RagA subfamily outer membrane receptor [Chryseobacterium sp. BIGb0232]ROS20027.1 TonB-dependent SusC/RagA subfamily outer membrane receptor [Chryseobacterium nakagawai]
MNFKFTSYIILLTLLFSSVFLKAQNTFPDFGKEKTYIQTNHIFYKPGEEMYFKIYVVQGKNNLPAEDSKVVNWEIIDPAGSVLTKSKYEVNNGYAEGYFFFANDMKGGIYKIRAYTNWMQNEEGKNAFEKEITLQKIVSPRILMKLDFPKKGYGPGDEVTADFSMRSLGNLPIPFYEADYVVTHNGETVTEGKLATDKEGKKLLKFRLPQILKSSDALLNIKVNFDGFTESISRNIPIVLNHLDVKFLPEGGTFISGVEQNIAFKILDEYEKPVDAVLNIYNQRDEKITEVSAYNFGMGSFLFTPKTGETYYAKVVKPEKITRIYHLPVPKNEGLVLNIKKENEKLSFKTASTQERDIILKGFFREKEIYSKELSLKNGISLFELPEKNFPVGICRFTLFENNVPIAERIVFTNKDQQLNIKVKSVKDYYQPREKVVLNIETTNRYNNPIPANLAISVVDDKLWTYADDKQNHIISWLLMDSELKGKIEKPQFYFDTKEEKADKSLDLVMLTNGYRYFEPIPEIIKTGKYKYLPEKKGTIYGVVEDENKNPVKADVFLVEINDMQILKQTTAENGKFYFSGMKYSASYRVIAKSLKPRHKVKIRVLAYKLEINPLAEQKLKNIDVEEIIKESEIKETPKKTTPVTQSVRPEDFISSDGSKSNKNIEEVILVGYGTTMNKKTNTSSVSITANSEIKDSNYGSVLQGKVAGLYVIPAGDQQKGNIVIRGASSIPNKSPLFVVDGVPVENFNTAINPNDANSITVLKDAAATAIYGSRAANGVVIINSYTGSTTQNKFDITPQSYFAVMTIPSTALTHYSESKHFAYPEYKTTNTPYRFDYREALYWNPVVETDKNGKAKIEFYNSDATSTFRAITEGISASGLIGRDETTYAAQSLISIDAKIPQYLTRTDEMLIPVVIKNNSKEIRKMTMDVIVPNHVKLISSDSLITLKPLESGRLYAKIQTDEVVNSNIQFIIRSGDFRETMILPFKVEEKGFLHQFSVIDNKAQEIQLDIPEYINGSLFSSYNLFENTALKMFNDLERLKKEPHGCFEQLSSTVYPNIFILDYLKSSQRIDSSTESLVIRNLKKGFQKMLSYKNKDGGVGYFNTTESDVSLSAFALLEFTDLKKHIAVDPKLIQELSSFILSKKSGNGLFEVRKFYESKSATYSEYYWSRNMYVLYALSKLGFKTEIEDSYQVLLNRALLKNDAYQLALLANISANLGKSKEYDTLVFTLNKQFEDLKFKAETTFTGSGGISADAEALSLYIMALQKDEKHNQKAIVKVADMLMSYNGVYGFGSTQATSLALQALSQVFIKNEQLYSNDVPVIKVNNASVSSGINVSSAYKTGNNKISISYPAQAGLFYNLEYQYYTLQAPKNVDIPLMMDTKLKSENSRVGETSRMTITIKNKINNQLPMTVAKIGIPAGLTLQSALMKDLIDKKQISYYEIFDNYLVLYWEHFGAEETKTINLDLKVEFAGTYTGKSSNVYLYYMPEAKYWNQGIKAEVLP